PVFAGLFLLLAILSMAWFSRILRSPLFFMLATIWIMVQSYVAWTGFYLDENSVPPRLVLFSVFPLILLIMVGFISAKGKQMIGRIPLQNLTWFHTIRIPVEIFLFLLFKEELVPQEMTFEGHNYDLLSGISAPIVALIAFRNHKMNRTLLLIWNIACLVLLAIIVVTAVLAVPSPFQKIGLDQPNVAVLYFPFVFLPALIVPLVLFAHLAAIYQLRSTVKD
ncbi:MAG: hypothetical protein KDC13_09875, partial [Bacteroidetes bacterium]|nr:hypothetical protein [Bacteroidota bacterium]